ncbi:MAG TPA: sugar ABC transporter permease [Erysipelotrichaceae bacterium]|nr:sugar ABC transporter permease [Erysipelotrichaceae bacterium]
MVGVVIAFKDFSFRDGIFNSAWVGFEHFRALFQDPEFWRAIRNTIAINVLKIIFCFPFPIIFAICLSEMKIKWVAKVSQTLSYLPHFIPWVIVAAIFTNMLTSNGLVNNILNGFGIESISWLEKSWFFWPLMVITGIWKEMGWNAIIYMAALSSVNPELYEAADTDGASRWQKVKYVTIPAILPTIKITFLITLAGLFNAGFDQIYLFQNGLVMDVAEVLDTFIYRYGLSKMMYSYSTAAGLFQSLVNFTILIAANKICKKMTGSGIY